MVSESTPSPSPSPSPAQRLFQGWRGIMACIIIVTHLPWKNPVYATAPFYIVVRYVLVAIRPYIHKREQVTDQ